LNPKEIQDCAACGRRFDLRRRANYLKVEANRPTDARIDGTIIRAAREARQVIAS
jgi:hypothetical protein